MKRVKMVVLLTLMMLFMTGIWLIDLGSSSLAIERTIDIKLIGQSLMMTATPNAVYHTGLILCGTIFLILGCMYIFEVIRYTARTPW